MRFHYFNARFKVQNSDLEKQLLSMVVLILQTVFQVEIGILQTTFTIAKRRDFELGTFRPSSILQVFPSS